MAGPMFKLGEQKARPGVYTRWENAGGDASVSRPLGVINAVVDVAWGPLNETVTIGASESDPATLKKLLGTGKGQQVVEQAFEGGALFVHVTRVGAAETGTAPASTGENTGITFTALYPTTRELSVVVREGTTEGTYEVLVNEKREDKITNLEMLEIAPGEGDTPLEFVVQTVNNESKIVKASATGEALKQGSEELAGGKAPDITNDDYITAAKTAERTFYDNLITDSEDPALLAAFHTFIRKRLEAGYRAMAIFGSKSGDKFADKIKVAKSFNDFAVVYVGNGFRTAQGDFIGALAAARVAGMIASSSYLSSPTFKTVRGAIEIIEVFSDFEYEEADKGGLFSFTYNEDDLVDIEYGINTLVSLAEDEDEGWKKIRRVRTRYELIDRIVAATIKTMRRNTSNSAPGRMTVCSKGTEIINQMIREGALESGVMIEDPTTPPHGDTAYFTFENLVDLDGLERAYITFPFRY